LGNPAGDGRRAARRPLDRLHGQQAEPWVYLRHSHPQASGIGGLGSTYALPSAVRPAYGGTPFSYMLFLRLKII
ncbi:MAG TPA: hypothetical protein VF502_04965, partial [Stellaceae bacterium]